MVKKNILWLASVDSTNSEAFKLLESEIIEAGWVVATRNQTAGRGQGQAVWESEPGKNLTFSLVLAPRNIHPAHQFVVNQAIALGVRDGVEKILQIDGFMIKWPNDIYFDRSKVAGILIENRIIGSVFEISVAGVGVNLNQEKFATDLPNPISLKNISAKDFKVDESLEIIVGSIWFWYQKLEAGQQELVKSAYFKYLLGLGVSRRFIARNQKFTATITGLDEYGRLKVKMPSGATEMFDSKEIQFLH